MRKKRNGVSGMKEMWSYLVEERGYLISFLASGFSFVLGRLPKEPEKKWVNKIAIFITVFFFLLGVALMWGGYTTSKGDGDSGSGNTNAAMDDWRPGTSQYQHEQDASRYEDDETLCRALAEQGDYMAIVQLLQDRINQDSTDSRYSDLLAQYETYLKEETLETARRFAESEQYRFALQTILDAERVYSCLEFEKRRIELYKEFAESNHRLAPGRRHTVVLNDDGTVSAVGDNSHGQCDVDDWTGIVQVSSGDFFTIGLKGNGTVVTAGSNQYKQRDIGGWTNIVAISAGEYHSVGLCADGTLVAEGWNREGQCAVNVLMQAAGEREIVSIAAGGEHTLVLLEDGTVLAIGKNDWGQCDVADWDNIVAIYAGTTHSLGLCADGTVVCKGYSQFDNCKVDAWTDVVRLTAGNYFNIGLKSDGSLIAVGQYQDGQLNFAGWTNVVDIKGGTAHTVARTADGRILATGEEKYGQCDVMKLD